MLAEQPPDSGMAFRRDVVNEQSRLCCVEDRVIGPSDRILVKTLPRPEVLPPAVFSWIASTPPIRRLDS